jgi:hypothetical protein
VKLTEEQLPELTLSFKAAQTMLLCYWDTLRSIEDELGADIEGDMEGFLSEANFDTPGIVQQFVDSYVAETVNE